MELRRDERAIRRIWRKGEAAPDLTKGGFFESHVYFAYSAGRIKIGTSINVHSRRRNLTGHSPLPVTILLTCPGDANLEASLHEQFASARLHGEWFTLTPALRGMIEANLCPKGRVALKKAEAGFRDWLKNP